MILNKEELIDRLFHKLVASNTRYPKWELKNIIDPFIEVLNEALSEGNEIRIRNFGKFTIRAKKGRRFYNIQTGSMDITKDKRMITFVQHRSLDSLHKNKKNRQTRTQISSNIIRSSP